MKFIITQKSVYKVIIAAFFLYVDTCGDRMNADFFMRPLTVETLFRHEIHKHVFRCHERQFGFEIFLDDLGINFHSRYYVYIQIENSARRKEGFRHGYTLIRGVVQSAFEPLLSLGYGGIESVDDDVSCKRSDSFAAHRVLLVSHCRRTYLIRFKRLVRLLHMAHQTNVGRELCRRLSDSRKNVQRETVCFSRIRLPRNGNDFFKPEFFRDESLEFENFILVVEELEKTRARTRRTLTPEKGKIIEFEIEPFKIFDKVVYPERRPFAERCGLSRLKMRVSENGQVFILIGKATSRVYRVDEKGFYFEQPLSDKQNVGVIGHKTRSRAQMNNGARFGAKIAERVNMRHHVVTEFLFVFVLFFVVYVVNMFFHLGNLLVGDRKSEFFFAFGKGYPEFSPGGISVIRRKYFLHFFVRVSFAKRT